MAAPSISTSNPANGAQDVFINKNLTVTFNATVLSSSVTNNTVFLVDIPTSTKVPVTISINSTTITIIAFNHLRENTAYRIVLVGQDTAVDEWLIDSASSDPLLETLVIEFETGDSSYIIDSTLEKEAQDFTLEGDLNLPSNTKALGYDFTLVKIRPVNHSHGVDLNITGDNTIRFVFNQALATGLGVDELATVNLYPILDDTSYLGTDSAGLGTVSLPSYSGYISGNQLVYQFSGNLPNNLNINIALGRNISGSNGNTYGGNLTYNITSKLYPEVFGVNAVKLELKSLNPELYDDYIGSVLFKNSIMLWERIGRGYNLSSPPWAAKKYILYATVLDIIQDQEYEKFLAAGTRKQVGDMNLAVDNLIGRLAMKVASATKAKELAFESLVAGWQFKTVTPNAAIFAEFAGSRLWFNVNGNFVDPANRFLQYEEPIANSSINRQAKANNPLDYDPLF